MPNRTMKLRIEGRVQGVGFRHWMLKQASKLSLKGYVKNIADGGVEAVISGEDHAIHEMLKKCLIGPLRAKVNNLNPVELRAHNVVFADFQILR